VTHSAFQTTYLDGDVVLTRDTVTTSVTRAMHAYPLAASGERDDLHLHGVGPPSTSSSLTRSSRLASPPPDTTATPPARPRS
jgi:hypothetical protein